MSDPPKKRGRKSRKRTREEESVLALSSQPPSSMTAIRCEEESSASSYQRRSLAILHMSTANRNEWQISQWVAYHGSYNDWMDKVRIMTQRNKDALASNYNIYPVPPKYPEGLGPPPEDLRGHVAVSCAFHNQPSPMYIMKIGKVLTFPSRTSTGSEVLNGLCSEQDWSMDLLAVDAKDVEFEVDDTLHASSTNTTKPPHLMTMCLPSYSERKKILLDGPCVGAERCDAYRTYAQEQTVSKALFDEKKCMLLQYGLYVPKEALIPLAETGHPRSEDWIIWAMQKHRPNMMQRRAQDSFEIQKCRVYLREEQLAQRQVDQYWLPEHPKPEAFVGPIISYQDYLHSQEVPTWELQRLHAVREAKQHLNVRALLNREVYNGELPCLCNQCPCPLLIPLVSTGIQNYLSYASVENQKQCLAPTRLLSQELCPSFTHAPMHSINFNRMESGIEPIHHAEDSNVEMELSEQGATYNGPSDAVVPEAVPMLQRVPSPLSSSSPLPIGSNVFREFPTKYDDRKLSNDPSASDTDDFHESMEKLLQNISTFDDKGNQFLNISASTLPMEFITNVLHLQHLIDVFAQQRLKRAKYQELKHSFHRNKNKGEKWQQAKHFVNLYLQSKGVKCIREKGGWKIERK